MDGLLVIRHRMHCFIVLYLHEEKKGYVADGTNMCLTNEEILGELEDITGLRLSPRAYHQQTRIDHCGGSGACIALAFMSSYRKNNIPDVLKIATSVKNTILKRLHKEPSRSMISKYKLTDRNHLKCSCGRKVFRNDRALIRHRQLKGCE